MSFSLRAARPVVTLTSPDVSIKLQSHWKVEIWNCVSRSGAVYLQHCQSLQALSVVRPTLLSLSQNLLFPHIIVFLV